MSLEQILFGTFIENFDLLLVQDDLFVQVLGLVFVLGSLLVRDHVACCRIFVFFLV